MHSASLKSYVYTDSQCMEERKGDKVLNSLSLQDLAYWPHQPVHPGPVLGLREDLYRPAVSQSIRVNSVSLPSWVAACHNNLTFLSKSAQRHPVQVTFHSNGGGADSNKEQTVAIGTRSTSSGIIGAQ